MRGNRIRSKVVKRWSVLLIFAFLWTVEAAPPGPPLPPPPPPPDRVAEVRRRLATETPVDVTAQRAIQYGRRYLAKAERALQEGQRFVADRFADAADALVRVADHQRQLRRSSGPSPTPSPEEIEAHLQRVYFRTEQADYFAREARDEGAKPLVAWARDFYHLSSRCYDRRDWVAAEENARCAEDVVKALESLAQAATMTIPPVPPAPPAPPRPPHS